MVRLFEMSARAASVPLQRTASTGILTDASYVQLTGEGVATIDLAFPCRYTRSNQDGSRSAHGVRHLSIGCEDEAASMVHFVSPPVCMATCVL